MYSFFFFIQLLSLFYVSTFEELFAMQSHRNSICGHHAVTIAKPLNYDLKFTSQIYDKP